MKTQKIIVIALIILIIATTLILTNKPQQQTNINNSTNFVTRIIDGDTFELDSGERVRMICIDSKEHDENSTRFLERLILNQTVRLERDVSDKDEYGRLLRYVYLGDLFVNKVLVQQGYASVFRYGNDTRRCDEIAGDI